MRLWYARTDSEAASASPTESKKMSRPAPHWPHSSSLILSVLAVGAALLLQAGLASGQSSVPLNPTSAKSYTFTQLDVPGSIFTEATAINNANQIVGSYTDSANHGHGFVYDGSTFTTIDFPGAVDTEAFGINDRGDVVGNFVSAPICSSSGCDSTAGGFLKSGASFNPISVPGVVAIQLGDQ